MSTEYQNLLQSFSSFDQSKQVELAGNDITVITPSDVFIADFLSQAKTAGIEAIEQAFKTDSLQSHFEIISGSKEMLLHNDHVTFATAQSEHITLPNGYELTGDALIHIAKNRPNLTTDMVVVRRHIISDPIGKMPNPLSVFMVTFGTVSDELAQGSSFSSDRLFLQDFTLIDFPRAEYSAHVSPGTDLRERLEQLNDQNLFNSLLRVGSALQIRRSWQKAMEQPKVPHTAVPEQVITSAKETILSWLTYFHPQLGQGRESIAPHLSLNSQFIRRTGGRK